MVDQWYVMDGTVYFFLSGNGMWRYDLDSGKYEKLADTTDKTMYGKAVFSDDYMLLLNDDPETSGGTYTGDDALYVYKLDGTLVKELSLRGIADKAAVSGIKLLFNSGSLIGFVADAGTMSEGESGDMGGVSFSSMSKNVHDMLYLLDMETGELTFLTEYYS